MQDLDAAGKELMVSIHSNLAATNIKLGEFTAAKKNCDDALTIDPKNVKALFRRAQAQMAGGNAEEAIVDLKSALQVDSRNAAVSQLLAKAKAVVKAHQVKERNTFGGIFEKLSKLEDKNKSAPTVEGGEERPETDTVMTDAPATTEA